MTDLIEVMKEIDALKFLATIWGGGSIFLFLIFVLTYIKGDPAGIRQVKRGSLFALGFLVLLTIVIVWYSIWFMNY